MPDEILDLVDKNDNIIGTVKKSDAHKDPKLIHREIAIAIFNDQDEVILQQRSMSKSNDPGKWMISAAGHVGVGENPEQTTKREVKEELGLDITPTFHNKKYLEYKDKEARFFYLYYATVKGNPKLTLDREEVMDAKWVKIDKLEEFGDKHYYDPNGLSHKTIMGFAKILKFV